MYAFTVRDPIGTATYSARSAGCTIAVGLTAEDVANWQAQLDATPSLSAASVTFHEEL